MTTTDSNLAMLLYRRQLSGFHRALSMITEGGEVTNEGMCSLLQTMSQGRDYERYLSFVTREHLAAASFYASYRLEFTDGKVEEKYFNVGFCIQLIQDVIDASNPMIRKLRERQRSYKLQDERYLVRLLLLFAELLPPNSICNRFEKQWIEDCFKKLGFVYVLSYARN